MWSKWGIFLHYLEEKFQLVNMFHHNVSLPSPIQWPTQNWKLFHIWGKWKNIRRRIHTKRYPFHTQSHPTYKLKALAKKNNVHLRWHFLTIYFIIVCLPPSPIQWRTQNCLRMERSTPSVLTLILKMKNKYHIWNMRI